MNNKKLFNEIITDRGSFDRYRNSTETFMPLIKYIYEINNIKLGEVFATPQSSDAVFRIGDTVIKIFQPPEANMGSGDREYITEVKVMEHARNAGILVPDMIGNGTVYDEPYTFNYTVMNYIKGISANEALLNYNNAEKVDFAFKLKEIMTKFNVPNPDLPIPRFDEPGRINNIFWSRLPESFKEDRMRYIKNTVFPELVICKGDTGGQNIIIDGKGRLFLIDFAESNHAPYYYDLPLLYSEPVLMEAYYGDYKNEDFYDMVTISELISWWCGIGGLAEETGTDIASITSVDALKNMIVKKLTEDYKHE